MPASPRKHWTSDTRLQEFASTTFAQFPVIRPGLEISHFVLAVNATEIPRERYSVKVVLRKRITISEDCESDNYDWVLAVPKATRYSKAGARVVYIYILQSLSLACREHLRFMVRYVLVKTNSTRSVYLLLTQGRRIWLLVFLHKGKQLRGYSTRMVYLLLILGRESDDLSCSRANNFEAILQDG